MAKAKQITVGAKMILQRPTFLHNGIFVLQGSQVEIKEIGTSLTVEWYDREGNPHLLDGIKVEELAEIT